VRQTITLTLEVEREDDQYVSFCPELDVSSYGDTVEEALQHLRDAVALYLETIEQDGELERVFRERGIDVSAHTDSSRQMTLHPGLIATVDRFPIGVG